MIIYEKAVFCEHVADVRPSEQEAVPVPGGFGSPRLIYRQQANRPHVKALGAVLLYLSKTMNAGVGRRSCSGNDQEHSRRRFVLYGSSVYQVPAGVGSEKS